MPDQDTPKYSENTGRAPAILAAALLALGAIVSWFGLNGGALVNPQPTDAQSPAVVPSEEAIKVPTSEAEKQALLTAGEAVSRAKCSGCHDNDSRLTGPPFDSIARKFSSDFRANPSQLPPALSQAVTHNYKDDDLGGYESATQLTLTPDERRAVGFWILNAFRKTSLHEAGSQK